jgi:D-arginine dehydrogenase
MAGAHLLNTGHNVTLFEKEKQVGQHATGRNAGSFSLHYGSLEVCQLAEQSRHTLEKPFWMPPGSKGYLHQRGKVFLARKEQSAAILRLQEKTKSNGHKLEKLPPEEALNALAPLTLRPLPEDQFLFDPDHFDIDVPRLVGDLEQFIHRHPKGTLITSFEVARIESKQDKWHIYKDQSNDSAVFDIVVNAAGAWADRIAQSAHVPPIGLKNLGRTAAWLDFEHDFSKQTRNVPMVHEVEDRFFARPFQNQWFLSPSDAVEGRIEEALPDLKALKAGVESFQSWFPGLKVENISPFVGIRSFSRDNRPEISQNKLKPTYFTLSALGGYGVKMSARAAEILVDKINSFKS